MYSLPAFADTTQDLLDELRTAPPEQTSRILRELDLEWSKSGSAAMDLLLKRGRDALEIKDLDAAIEHLTALTDHAPDFAEGWHTRARAFFEAERFGMAMADLERTLALNPDHIGAIQGVAAVLDTLGYEKAAYDAYRIVLDYHPNSEEGQKAFERLKSRVSGTSL